MQNCFYSARMILQDIPNKDIYRDIKLIYMNICTCKLLLKNRANIFRTKTLNYLLYKFF